MITFFEFFGTLSSLTGIVIIFCLRVEHRLTQMETTLKLHIKNDRECEKAVNPPL